MRADLHIHTYYSADGIGAPDRVFDMARAAGLNVIALAEHNTCAHIEECLALAGLWPAPRYVPAAEISCTTRLTGSQEVHLLCYFVDARVAAWRSSPFQALIDSLAEIQKENLRRIARELGISEVDVDDALAWCHASGAIHWAVAPSTYYLRRRYGAHGPEHPGPTRAMLSEARRRLRDSGRVVPYPDVQGLKSLLGRADCRWFLAHPGRYGWSDALTEQVVRELVRLDLSGIETNHLPSIDAEPRLRAIAERHGLRRSVGSDLHSFEDTSAEKYGQVADVIALPESALDWLWWSEGAR